MAAVSASSDASTVLVKLLGKNKVAPVSLDVFEELKKRIPQGRVILASDADYEGHRRSTFNLAINPFPSAVIVPNDADDVAESVKWANEHGIELTVACGRHTVHSAKTNRVALDLRKMSAVLPLPSADLVHVQGGAKLLDIDKACAKYGLAIVAGTNYDTGVGGWTLGGGWGFLSRQKGLGVDNLVEAEVVLANGSIVIANAQQNSDLFWALRGAGANFGIVTRFTFHTYRIESVYGGVLGYTFDAARPVLELLQATLPRGPRNVATMAALGFTPGGRGPESYRQRIALLLPIFVGLGAKGDEGEAERIKGRAVVEKQLTAVPDPVIRHVQDLDYHKHLQHLLDKVSPAGLKYYEKHLFVKELSSALIDLIIGQFEKTPHAGCQLIFIPMGGRIGDFSTRDTAVASRLKECFWLISYASAPTGTDEEYDQARAWAQDNARVFEPFRAGLFVNELGGSAGRDVDMESASSSALMSWSAKDLFSENIDRLQAIKAKFDPKNFFCNNHNITPLPTPSL